MRAVRIFKQTISIFLTVQLLVSFGLCGGLCCIKTAELPVSEMAVQTAESEENLPPCHRKKVAEKKEQSHSAETNHHTASKFAVAILNRNCCAMKREIPEGESLPSTVAPQIGKEVVVLTISPWADDGNSSSSASVPVCIPVTHSLPHTGFQLSLRI